MTDLTDAVLYIRCMNHRFVGQLNRSKASGGECGACIAADYWKDARDFQLVTRERLESAVPEKDCGGRRYEPDEREDIIRYMIQAAEIQRDNDERVAALRRIAWEFPTKPA